MKSILLAWATLSVLFGSQALAAQTAPTPATQANPPGPGTPTGEIPNPQTADEAVPPAMPADPNYHGSPYKGALTPPPPEAMNKDYPVCGGEIQDSCINPTAAREK